MAGIQNNGRDAACAPWWFAVAAPAAKLSTTGHGTTLVFHLAQRWNLARGQPLSDTSCFPVQAIVHGADIQDHDRAPIVLGDIRYHVLWLRHGFFDCGYAGDKLRQALTNHSMAGYNFRPVPR